ncbi:DUF5719 family protein [Amnibacterium sp.]|uniref:DUF5719 family protein n=1 Tax=Amnibacterium sp. TaxID=1872496 RepID=UPI0026075494|nr:DUF5719 family protein [Amnibacterium sp.]MCU1474861.1 hypothetical protein [Amnibacterium sp.]
MAVTSRLLGASGVVIVGVVVAAVLGQLPAVGAESHAIVATPSSPVQRLVCPGSPVAVGAAGQKASTLSADGSPTRHVDVAGSGSVTGTTLGGGAVKGGSSTRPRLFTAPAADAKHGAIAGAQSQTVTTGDASGLAASACSVPVNTAWVAAGSTTTGRTTVLTLANASSVPAQVSLDVWTENGRVDTAGGTEVLVGARSRLAVSLASIAPSAAGTAVQVTSTGGQLGVAVEQRVVRGLESGGLDLTGPTAAPATRQVITGVRIANASAVAAASATTGYGDLLPVLRLLAPGTKAADVRVTITGSSGSGHKVLSRHIEAGKVTDITLPGLTDGVYSLDVQSSQPVVTGARVATVTDESASTTDTGATVAGATTGTAGTDGSVAGGTSTGTDSGLVGGNGTTNAASGMNGTPTTATARGIDLAWIAAADPLGRSATVAVADGPGATLSLANPTDHTVSVKVAGVGGSTVKVPAGGTAVTRVQPGVGTVTGGSGLRAAISYAGSDAVAAYPVAPADQAAHPVRVTH